MSKSTNTLLAFAAGVATGAVIGILFAPDKGKNTRDKLSFQLDKYRNKLQEFVDDVVSGKETPTSVAKEKGEKLVEDARQEAERLMEEADALLKKIKVGK